jgi:surface polysaccharide O-acyltransferase-like enzyme
MLFFAFYETHLQAFFMGILFLIAGYFAASSLDRKGPRRFIADRAVRLGIPTLIYALLIHPLIRFLLESSANHRLVFQPANYVHYIVSLEFLSGTGPMWFALALLIFCCGYAVLRTVSNRRDVSNTTRLPTDRTMLALIAVMATGSFLVRLVQPIGTSIMNMQLCFFVQYIVLFTIGAAVRRMDLFTRIPTAFGMRWLRLAVLIGPLIWAGIIVVARPTPEQLTGGLHWQSAAYSIWESFFCAGMCVGLLTLFRRRWDTQGALARFLSANSFAVYMFHAPILVALGLAMSHWAAPPFAKFLLLSALGLVASFAIADQLLRRIPGLRRIL